MKTNRRFSYSPRASEILIFPYITQPIPSGADAEAFRPERFAPEELGEPSALCVLPLGEGPRTALG